MDNRAQPVIPQQGSIASDEHHLRRGDHPLLDKLVSHLNEPTTVCNRICSHSGYATLPGYFNILYQSFMPNCKLSVKVLKRYYKVSDLVTTFILRGGSMRICNQRLLTFILTEFEKDYDISRFCVVIEQLIQLPELRRIADKLRNVFPIKPKEDIPPVVTDSVEDTSDALAADRKEFGAECLQSSSIEGTEGIVDTTMKEAGASRAPIITIRRERNQTFLLDHHPVVSDVTDHASMIHENTNELLETAATSWNTTDPISPLSLDTGTPPTLDDKSHMLDSFTQDTSHLSEHSPYSSLTAYDELSEEVKHKPTPTKPIDFLRSLSSETSSPAKSPSGLASNTDHHHSLPSSYSDSLPLSDRPLLEAVSPAAAVGKEIRVTLQPSAPPTAAAAAVASCTGTGVTPIALLESKGFEPLQSRYSLLYQHLPEDYMTTVSKLERHLADNEITEILSAPNAVLANRKILDSLIMHMKCKEDLLDLCDQLEKISGSRDMNNIINDLRNDVVKNIQKDAVPTSSQPQVDSEPSVFSQLTYVDPNSKVMKILKKYYSSLCHSLPADYNKSIAVLNKMGYCPTYVHALAKKFKAFGSSLKARQYLLDSLILTIDCEEAVLDICDLIDWMVEDDEMKHYIESFRNEILAVLSSEPAGSTPARHRQHKVVRKKVMVMQVFGQPGAGADLNQLSELSGRMIDSEAAIDIAPGVNISQPPSIPPYYVKRPVLEKELTDAVLKNDQDKNEAVVTVTVTGDAGFGKSTLAKAFCHSEEAKQNFTNGFILIELGPNALNPLYKLMHLYYLLSHGSQLDGADTNSILQNFHSMIVKKHPKVLVIIDDVCKAHEAQPYVTAFRSCKIIVTTRSGDVAKQLSSCKIVSVGPMECSEATKLLLDIPVQIADDDERIVDELATDLYFWPLLICLARGQFQVSQGRTRTIEDLQNQLYGEGLEHIAYNIDKDVTQGRKVAVAACIEASLQLLEDANEHDCLVNLVHHSGVGGVTSFRRVTRLWNMPEGDCVQLLTKLDSMGLLVFTHAAAGNTKATVKVHSVISQYLVDTQVYNPPAHMDDSQDKLEEEGNQMGFSVYLLSRQGRGNQAATLPEKIIGTPEHALTTALHSMDEHGLSSFMHRISSQGVSWGQWILIAIDNLYATIINSSSLSNSTSLVETADRLSSECQSVTMEYPQEVYQLKESTKMYLNDRNYESAKQVLKQYFNNNSLKRIGSQTKHLADQVYSNCGQYNKRLIKRHCEFLYCFTPEYDFGLNVQLPQLLLMVDLHQRITTALASGPSAMEEVAEEVWAGKMSEQSGLLNDNYMIKLQEVAPHYVSEQQGGFSSGFDIHMHNVHTHASTEV